MLSRWIVQWLVVCWSTSSSFWLLLLSTTIHDSNGETAHAASVSAAATVSYDQRSFLISQPNNNDNNNNDDTRRLLILSGSIHYPRIPRSDWYNVLSMARELGLNTIQTYVFWNEHEKKKGVYDWKGDLDLIYFIQLAQSLQLHVVVRIGPYICGEYYFGGIPLWMRHSGAQCFRCNDPLWKFHVHEWMSIVVQTLEPYLLPNGGPILMLQTENEYNVLDDYFEWSIDMALNLTTQVPWNTCHAVPACSRYNEQYGNNRVLCTINGFWMDVNGKGKQPGTEFMDYLWKHNPHMPAVWTEDQGWFNRWGEGKKVRQTHDQLYGMARFFAYGGSYHNLYMLVGGNHYGRSAGQVITAYAADTTIDSNLLRHQPRFGTYQKFFSLLTQHQDDLLSHPVATAETLPSFTFRNETQQCGEFHRYGELVFLSNYCEDVSDAFVYNDRQYFLPNTTVLMVQHSSGTLLLNSSDVVDVPSDNLPARIPVCNWKSYHEKIQTGKYKDTATESPEQLNITNNDSDYLWYSFPAFVNADGNDNKVHIEPYGWDNVFYVFDGSELSTTRELRQDQEWDGSHSKRTVSILSVAMGLAPGGVGPQVGKGIKSVTIGNQTYTRFDTAWWMQGEHLEIYSHQGSSLVEWSPVKNKNGSNTMNVGYVWFQGNFSLPRDLAPFAGGAQPNQTALVVNLSALYKGVLYVNGRNLGRYWMLPGICEGECARPRPETHCYMYWKDCGLPTQTRYHIPFEVLRPTNNLLTVFEETAPPDGSQRELDKVYLEILHEHHV